MLVRYVIVCDASLLDSRSNNASLIEIIEELRTGAFPVDVRFDVVCLFEKEAGDPEIPDRVALTIALNDVELRKIPVSINFAGDARSRIFAEVRSLKLATAGRLDVDVLSDGKKIGSWWVNVSARQEAVRRLH